MIDDAVGWLGCPPGPGDQELDQWNYCEDPMGESLEHQEYRANRDLGKAYGPDFNEPFASDAPVDHGKMEAAGFKRLVDKVLNQLPVVVPQKQLKE